MTNPSDIARAMDAVQGLMADKAPARPMLTNHQWLVLEEAVTFLKLAGHVTMSAALADAFGITGSDLKYDREGDTNDRP